MSGDLEDRLDQARAAIFDPATYTARMPYEELALLREHQPVCRVPEAAVLGWPEGPGYWAVFRHADVKAVLRNPAVFSSQLGGTQIRDPRTPEDLDFVRRMMLNMDPPDHTRLRRLLHAAFTPRAVAALEAGIKERAAKLADGVMGRDRFDVVTDLVSDLPVNTLASILGMPEEDNQLIYDWANRVIGYQDPEYSMSARYRPEGTTSMAQAAFAERQKIQPGPDGRLPDPRSKAGLADLYAYAQELAAHKRRHPGNDILSTVLLEGVDGDRCSVEEYENLFFLFAVAGNETLRNGMPGGMSLLLEHPDAYDRLRADQSLLPSAIEEMLRCWPPVIDFRRTATCDTVIGDPDDGGVEVKAGEKVVVYFAAANRDPAVFADPDTFDITRSENDHLSFGAGPHFCIGAHLARTQMRAMFTEILTRLPRLEPDGEVERLTSNFQNGLKHLPVRVA